jgi:hypothetical protein
MKFSNPYGIPYANESRDAWDTGFGMGFCGPTDRSIQLPMPPIVQAGNTDNFTQGVADGQRAALFGWDVVDPPCMEAREGEPPGLDADSIIAIVHVGVAIKEWAMMATGVGIITAMMELVFTGYGEVWTTPVERTALPIFGQRVASILSSRGINSCAIYMGAAADALAQGKELCVTPLFRTKGQAKRAATLMGRKQWVVMEWRTDASGSFRIVDGPGW